MDGITLVLMGLVSGAIVAYLVFQHLHRQRMDDQVAAFWANVREPLCYRSQDIEDADVVMRAENAKAKLSLHGNKYLTGADVYYWVYRSDKDDATADFMAWADLRDLQAQEIRKAFRQLKASQMESAGNQQGAAQMFGQQKTGAI